MNKFKLYMLGLGLASMGLAIMYRWFPGCGI